MLTRILRLKRGRSTPLRSQVTEILRDAILSGQLAPGSVLVERELAERLGVSKTPVREALSLLDHEGLVQTVPRKGYFVSPITVQDVHNYFGLRLILECASAEMAASAACFIPAARPIQMEASRARRGSSRPESRTRRW